MEAQISRRIVSKREYAAVQAKRGGLTAAALILGIIYVVYVYAAVKYYLAGAISGIRGHCDWDCSWIFCGSCSDATRLLLYQMDAKKYSGN